MRKGNFEFFAFHFMPHRLDRFRHLFVMACLAPAIVIASFAGHAGAETALSYVSRADVLIARGELQQALLLLDAAQADEEAVAADADRAQVLARYGQVLSEIGSTDRASPVLAQAAGLALDTEQPGLRARVLNDFGNLLSRDDAASAIERYRQSIELARGEGDTTLAARASINAARVELRRGDLDGAEALLARAGADLDAGDGGNVLERLSIAAVALEIATEDDARTEPAWQALKRAREMATSARDKSWANGLMGELYALAGRDDEALALYRRAALDAETAAAPEVLYRWQWQVGRILKARGQLEEAIAAYRSAATNLYAVRLDLPAFDPRTGRSLFREILGPVFTELADLLLRRAGDAGGVQADLVEARSTIERLKTVELEDYFRDDCAADLSARVRPIDEVRESTAVLYPVLLSDRTELILSLPGGRLVSGGSKAGVEEIGDLARELRAAIDGTTGFGDFEVASRRLYDLLIRPVDEALVSEGVTTLVFIPDGPLRNIPLSVLHDGERFLVERMAVATGIGLSLLDTTKIERDNLEVLVAGLSTESRDVPIAPGQTIDFEALPGVEREIDRLMEIVRPDVTLLNDSFTREAFREQVTSTPFNVVHLATHGYFAGDPDFSFVLAFDERLKMNELESIIGISRFRDQPIELLTLSACQTASGDDRSALGLAGVAVKVGARSAFATLWNISDDSTVQLVGEFYNELLQPEVNKAEALRRAQLGLIRSGTFSHPYFWSPFILIGNWT